MLIIRRKGRGSINGQMAILMKGSGKEIVSMGKECIVGQMVRSMKDSGWITKCMVMASIVGLMEGLMKDIMKGMSNKVKESSNGQMALPLKDFGRMEGREDWLGLSILMDRSWMLFGRMANYLL